MRTALALLSDGEWEAGGLGPLAKRCGVSEAYLSRVFARHVGVSLTRYRSSVRLAKFWELYREPTRRRTIAEAVYAAGLEVTRSSTRFSRRPTDGARGTCSGLDRSRPERLEREALPAKSAWALAAQASKPEGKIRLETKSHTPGDFLHG